MAFAIPFVATAALNAGVISVGTATAITGVASTIGTIGSVISGLGVLSQGSAASAAHSSNAAMANYNAQVAARNSAAAIAAANQAAKEEREDTARRIGTIRSAYGKAGVVTTSGSPLLAAVEQAEEGELEAQKLLYAGKLKSQGFDAEANIQTLVGRDEKAKASSARTNSFLSAGSAILTGRSLFN